MEAVGLAGSLIALIEAANYTAKTTRNICRRYRDAPRNLAEAELNLCLLKAHMQAFHQLVEGDTTQIISDDISAAIQSKISSTRVILENIQEACDRFENPRSRRDRGFWALRGQPFVEAHFRDLADALQMLGSLIQIYYYEEQSQIARNVTSLMDMAANVPEQATLSHSSPSVETTPKVTDISRRPTHHTTLIDTASFKWLQWLGVHFTLLEWNSESPFAEVTNYSLAFHIPILLGYYALLGQLKFRRYMQSLSLAIDVPSTLSIGRIVDRSSVAMVACNNGDLNRLMKELQHHRASLGDVTRENWPLMKFAITGGNIDVVRFLLDNGIDVNATFGALQTSALQWALNEKQFEVVKLLVSRGAHVNHVSLRGWTPVVYCWPQIKQTNAVMLEQIRLLSRDEPIDLNVVDRRGWTVLQRVAAYGVALDIKELVRLGADLMIRQKPLEWLPLFHAVFYGNLQTLVELLRHYPESIAQQSDARGWTLLHVAASAGHWNIARHLLGIGFSPNTRSKPFFSHMPSCIHGKECTPAEVAEAQSPERHSQFQDLLIKLGHSIEGWTSGEGPSDEFWDASDGISI